MASKGKLFGNRVLLRWQVSSTARRCTRLALHESVHSCSGLLLRHRPPRRSSTPSTPTSASAAEILAGPLLIVAGPGTGKTRTLTHRLAHLVTTGAAAPGECLAVTFTRRAAAEMKERLEALLPGRGKDLTVADLPRPRSRDPPPGAPRARPSPRLPGRRPQRQPGPGGGALRPFELQGGAPPRGALPPPAAEPRRPASSRTGSAATARLSASATWSTSTTSSP